MITSERLIIRPLTLADLPQFLAYRKRPEVLRYQGMGPMNEEQATSFIEEMQEVDLSWIGKWMQMGIEQQVQKRLIGDLALKWDAHDARLAEIGYTLHPAYQGMGYATEAVQHLLQFLFSHNNLHRVTALVDVRNPASYKLLERLGFTREAHYRKSYFDKIDQDWFDEFRYALLKADWRYL